MSGESQNVLCKICNENPASEILGVCRECLLEGKGMELVKKAHEYSRSLFGWKNEYNEGKECKLCPRSCKIKEGEYGFCGLVKNEDGKIIPLSNHERGLLEYYYDPLPTNCVAEYVCPECERGKGYNLAVFYCSCNLDCLFCQNWQWKERLKKKSSWVSKDEMIRAGKREGTRCICFFGGDPSSQIVNSISIGNSLRDEIKVCWETNGIINKKFLKIMIEIAKESGGIIKFDFKAINENIYYALTGSKNEPLLENLKLIKNIEWERDYPLFVCSTLLVPNYINEEEIQGIAEFLSEINEDIPLILLAFHPHYLMKDIGFTRKEIAMRCYKIAKECLKEVYIGNIWLLR